MTKAKAFHYAQVILQPMALMVAVGFNSVIPGVLFLLIMEALALWLADDFWPERLLTHSDIIRASSGLRLQPPPLPTPAEYPPGYIETMQFKGLGLIPHPPSWFLRQPGSSDVEDSSSPIEPNSYYR